MRKKSKTMTTGLMNMMITNIREALNKCQFPLVVFPAKAGIQSITIDNWMPGQARQDGIDTYAELP
jgi:hypothetical protein